MAVIFHIDLNAFFANAEIARNSDLQGQPVAVAGLSRRSVVCTASYEARALGVRSAMPIAQALKLCPDLVVLPGDFSLYNKMSKAFFQLVKEYTHLVEPASIDECYVDMTSVIKRYERPLDLAWELQQRIQDELKLGCSIGIAPNKFLAKIASDLKKPMGITIIRKSELEKKLFPLPIAAMQGIGKKSAPKLIEAGISTIGDIANPENEQRLQQLLGKHAMHYIQNARGNGRSVLDFNQTLQSISQSTTMDNDVEDYAEIKAIFTRLAQQLATRSQKHDVKGQLVSISIRYTDFSTIVRSMTLDHYTNDATILLERALLLFDRNYESDRALRHVGITLGTLKSSSQVIEQISMFEAPKANKLDLLAQLNRQLQSGSLVYASSLAKENKYEH
ncbi:MAG: DNA polymerase IV [Erysipelotrichaceae bacterium]